MRETSSRSLALGLLGRKVGMTRIFTDDGDSVPVTVLDVSNNRVAQVRTDEIDGYSGVQVAHGTRRASRVTKPQAGHFSKAGIEAGSKLKEFRLDAEQVGELKAGSTVGIDTFSVGQMVDVTGVTIGKGFAGAIKRHHFSSNRATHGNSVSTNAPGSIGMASGSGSRVAGQAHGRSPGRQAAYDAKPGCCADRHRASAVVDSWGGTGGCGR